MLVNVKEHYLLEKAVKSKAFRKVRKNKPHNTFGTEQVRTSIASRVAPTSVGTVRVVVKQSSSPH